MIDRQVTHAPSRIPRPGRRSPNAGCSSPCCRRAPTPTTSSRSCASSPGRRASRRSREVVQHRVHADPRTLRRQGQARGAQGRRTPTSEAEVLIVDDELDPDAAARPRGRARGPRRRPDAADPRHLRPARRLGRGKAPGRAGAARVQPAAHARHVEAPRAARRRRRHARPRRVAARDRPPPGEPAHHAAQAPAPRRRRAPRDEAEGAYALGDADRRARRLHERRQVDAAERAHRRRGLGREPPLRDARSDDAVVLARRASATSSPTPSGSSAGCPRSSSRASPRRSRRRWSPTSSSTSSTARCPRSGSREQIAAVETRARRRSAPGSSRVELVVNKIDRLDAAGRGGASRTAIPEALLVSAQTGEGLDELKARIAERLRRPLRRRPAARAVRRRARVLSDALRARGADRRARRTPRQGVMIRARAPAPRRAAVRAPTSSPGLEEETRRAAR